MKIAAILMIAVILRSGWSANVTSGNFKAAAPQTEGAPAKGTRQDVTNKHPKSRKTYSFHGTVESVDRAAGTISLKRKSSARVIRVTPETRFARDKSAAAIGITDITAGSYISGSVFKSADGAETAALIRVRTEN